MKRFPLFLMLLLGCGVLFTACMGKDDSDNYKDWRKANEAWFAQQSANSAYYEVIHPTWNNAVSVLMHWYNDRSTTAGNLVPLYTSTVDVVYRGELYDATPFDSSYLSSSPVDSVLRFNIAGGVIEGWAVALTNMHIGDSCRVVIPYNLAYGSYSKGSVIKPYSMLVFDMKLKSVYAYETKQ